MSWNQINDVKDSNLFTETFPKFQLSLCEVVKIVKNGNQEFLSCKCKGGEAILNVCNNVFDVNERKLCTTEKL